MTEVRALRKRCWPNKCLAPPHPREAQMQARLGGLNRASEELARDLDRANGLLSRR
jgi:hypothetical protein